MRTLWAGLLLVSCGADIGDAIECGGAAWQEAPYSPVSMSEYVNVNGCWMALASESGGVADHEIEACSEASRCLVVLPDALVYAYGRPEGVSSFEATDVACDAVCP